MKGDGNCYTRTPLFEVSELLRIIELINFFSGKQTTMTYIDWRFSRVRFSTQTKTNRRRARKNIHEQVASGFCFHLIVFFLREARLKTTLQITKHTSNVTAKRKMSFSGIKTKPTPLHTRKQLSSLSEDVTAMPCTHYHYNHHLTIANNRRKHVINLDQ